jgi:hypothetical protein
MGRSGVMKANNLQRGDDKEEAIPECSCGDYCFLFRGALCVWQPQSWGFGIVLEDDNIKAAQCEASLLKRGLSFQTLDELVSHARAAGWPKWDQIIDSYYHSSRTANDDGTDECIVE